MLSMKDIAKAVGVSQPTVSVVLNNKPASQRVGAKTRERILETAERLGYRPNQAAQQLRGVGSRLIGVLLDTYTIVSQATLIRQLETCLRSHNYRMILGFMHDDYDCFLEHGKEFKSRMVDGVLVLSHLYPSFGRKIVEFVSENFPHNVFYKQPIGDLAVNYVDTDDEYKGFLAAKHLLEHGARHPVRIVLGLEYSDVSTCVNGFLRALKEHGLDTDGKMVVSFPLEMHSRPKDWTREAARRIRDLRADGVVCASDIDAMWLISAMRELGLRVPEDVRLVSLGRLPFGEAFSPSITAIDLDHERLAEKLAALLLADLARGTDENAVPCRCKHDFSLFRGKSCGCSDSAQAS